jgi:ATP-binding cassette subfamily B protein
VVDEGFAINNHARLNEIMLGVLAITLIGTLAVAARFFLMTWLGERVSADIRKQVYAHLLSLTPSFFEEIKTGEIISRFTSDTTVIQTVVGMSLSMALRSAVTFIGALGLMLYTSPAMTLYVLIAVPFILVPVRVLSKKVRHYARLSQDRVADIGAYVDESLHEIQTVQAYTHEEEDRKSFFSRVESAIDTAQKRIAYRAILVGSVMLISITAITCVAWLGASDVISSKISPGQLTAFMFYAVMAASGLGTISEVIGEIQKAAGASERLLEILNTKPLISSPENPHVMTAPAKGQLNFQQVSFAYPSAPDRIVIKDFNLTVKAGEVIALVGPSGAGKSTLFQLLLRFHPCNTGNIQLDGTELEKFSPTTLRKQFATVPQESVIFGDNALENIRYGNPSASIDEVHQAAKAAEAHEFIMNLPNKYDTNLGERGVKLSGGQKQRIAIARAILANSPILLLDEATSALDANNEKLIKQALDTLQQGRTTLIIAHRLSTVLNADRIVVMDQGEIIAQGTHENLLISSPLYKEFAELQLVN